MERDDGTLLVKMVRVTVAARLSRRPRSRALTLRPAYAAGLENRAAVEAATVPVQRIACPVMTISGGAGAARGVGRDAVVPAIHARRTLTTPAAWTRLYMSMPPLTAHTAPVM